MGNKWCSVIQGTGADHQNQVAGTVRNTVGRLSGVQALDPNAREAFFAALVHAAMFAAVGFPTGRRDIKGDPWTRMILMFDVRCAMERAGLVITHWRQDTTSRDPVEGESAYYRIARLVAQAVGVFMPLDAYKLAKRAETVHRL